MIRLAIILAVLVAPLAVYRVVDMAPPESWYRFTGGGFVTDMYGPIKASAIVLGAVFAIGGLFFAKPRPLSAVLFVFPLMALTLISAARSPHHDVMMQGAPHLAEGLVVLMSYPILMLAAAEQKYWRTVIGALCLGVLLMTAAGIAECLGHSYLTGAPYWLIGMDYGEQITHTGRPVTAMLGNENYLGHYVATTLPVMTMLSLEAKGWRALPFVLAALGGWFLLASSHSRLGAVGAVAGIIAGVVMRGRHGRRRS